MKNLHVRLDATTREKLKTFVIMNDVSYSEIIRVLIEKSKVKNIKSKIRDSKTINHQCKL